MLKTEAKIYLLFILTFCLYIYTAAPGIIWGDSAKLSILSFGKDFRIQPSAHSLWPMIGTIFSNLPLGNFAYRLNLVSALFGALSIVLVYSIVLNLTSSGFSALASAITLALSHTVWFLSTIAETYTAYAFFFLLTIYLVVRWYKTGQDWLIYFAILAFSLCLFNHLLIIVSLPGFIYFIFSVKPKFFFEKKNVFYCSVFALIGLSPAVFVFLRTLLENGFLYALAELKADPAIIWVAFKSPFQIIKECFRYLSFLMYQFPGLGFIIGFIGLSRTFFKDKKLFYLFSLIFFLNILFVFHYGRQKQYSLAIGSYAIFAICIGIGMNFLAKQISFSKSRMIKISLLSCLGVIPLVLYTNICSLTKKLNLDLVGARFIPYRDNNKFFLVPYKRYEFGPHIYAKEVFRTAEPGSIIVIDFTPKKVLDYYRLVNKARPDLKFVYVDYPFCKLDTKIVDENISRFSVYLASIEFDKDYSLNELSARYKWVPRGPLFQVLLKQS